MYFYAQINENNICYAVSSLSDEVIQEDMIKIDEFSNVFLNRKYIDGQWSEEKFEPESTAPITEFEKLQQKSLEQEQAIMELTIALATLQGGTE